MKRRYSIQYLKRRRTLQKRNIIRKRFGGGEPTPILKTAVGNPIHITDALARAVDSLKVEFAPQQSGSGDPSPDNVRPITGWTGCNIPHTGKNLFDVASANWENGHGLDSSGEETPNSNYKYTQAYTSVVPSTQYTLSFNKTTAVSAGVQLCEYDDSKTFIQRVVVVSTATSKGIKSGTFTAGATTKYIRFNAPYSSTAEGTGTADLQIEFGSEASSYEAYSGSTLSVTFTEAGTVYGGNLVINEDGSGVLTVDRAKVSGSDISWTLRNSGATDPWIRIDGLSYYYDATDLATTRGYFLCNKARTVKTKSHQDAHEYGIWAYDNATVRIYIHAGDTITEATAYMADCEICYKLATPTTYNLTLAELTLLQGENNLWSDTNGDLTLSYYADGNVSTIEALNTLLGGRYVNNHGEDEPSDEEALQIILGETR